MNSIEVVYDTKCIQLIACNDKQTIIKTISVGLACILCPGFNTYLALQKYNIITLYLSTVNLILNIQYILSWSNRNARRTMALPNACIATLLELTYL